MACNICINCDVFNNRLDIDIKSKILKNINIFPEKNRRTIRFIIAYYEIASIEMTEPVMCGCFIVEPKYFIITFIAKVNNIEYEGKYKFQFEE